MNQPLSIIIIIIIVIIIGVVLTYYFTNKKTKTEGFIMSEMHPNQKMDAIIRFLIDKTNIIVSNHAVLSEPMMDRIVNGGINIASKYQSEILADDAKMIQAIKTYLYNEYSIIISDTDVLVDIKHQIDQIFDIDFQSLIDGELLMDETGTVVVDDYKHPTVNLADLHNQTHAKKCLICHPIYHL